MISFAIAIVIFGLIGILLLKIHPRIIIAIILIPFLNPDFDQILDPECHRLFFTHSLIPSTLFWWCIYPSFNTTYNVVLLPILWFYPLIHLIGDLGGVKGYGIIKIFPYLRYVKARGEERKELDLKYICMNVKCSYAWIVGNTTIGIIGSILILF